MKKYWTSLTRDYVADWSAPEAVREILQNFLDSPAPFEYDFSGDTLDFTNKGITLHQSTILMGSSSKRNDPNSVGGKGEGYKIACLVLLREGYGVTIYNGNKIWTPEFEFNHDFEEEVLVFNEADRVGSDLTFSISGVNDELTSEIIENCLYLQSDLGLVYEGERGRVFMEKSGKLYVGGLFVCDINSKYTYDFHPKYLPLNRDRKSVSSWDLTTNTTSLLEEVLPAKELARMSLDRTLDSGGYYNRFKSEEVAEEVYALAKDEYGDNVVVAEDGIERDKLEKRGFKNVEVVYNDNQRNLIKDAPSYKEFIEQLENTVVEPEDTRTPIEMLEEWLDQDEVYLEDNVYNSFEKLLELFKERGVEWGT